MSTKLTGDSAAKKRAFSLSEWSLRRKVALALAIPMLLAAVFGGLRVTNELTEARNYSATASQVTVLRPAVAYLAAAENAAVVAREKTAAVDPERDKAVEAVAAAGAELEKARDAAELTPAQLEQVNSVLDLSAQLRTSMGYVSIGQSVAQVRTLHRGVTELIDTIVAEQIEPEPRLETLSTGLDGRVSLAMQQLAVAYGTGDLARPRQLAAEIGVESSAIERLGVALGATDPLVLSLRQQNALHFGTIRENGTDLGDASAFDSYDQLTEDLLGGIDAELTRAADESRNLAVVNSAVTIGTLLAAIILAFLISRLLLNPMRKVREGALEVAHERLPEAVARIRAGGDPGEIVPIPVTTHEEMGQLARAVDDLHRQAVHLASGEAAVRAQVGEMLVTLSRRNTSLINQQLGLIETLEKDEEDPQRLESLFRLDHLASRMRRTAESLMILADAPTQNRDQGGLSVSDLLHAATAGVQDYQRVQIISSSTERINGAASSDVVHLVTELIDNALSYSPPTAPVLVITTASPGGTVVQVSDAGLGIPDDQLVAINDDLHSGGEVTADTARRMGLLVVSRLARRHHITVTLERNDRNGTTATVTLPSSIVLRAAQPAPVETPDPVESNEAVELVESARLVTPPSERPVAVADAAESTVPAGADAEQSRIEAAISAVTGLPQRKPGSTDIPPSLNPISGGSLQQRLSAREGQPAAVTAPVTETPVTETPATEQAPAALTAVPNSTDDSFDSPIFRSLRSNFLSAGESEQPWTSNEVEAGWEAADRIALTPPVKVSDSGLPVRRPGNRLIPGGVNPVTTGVVRDPEAIRKRLAAHAAGVSRGRTAASVPSTDPVPDDPSQKEAGLA